MCKGAVVAVIIAENGVDCKSLEEAGYVDNVLDKLVISRSKLVYSCLYVLNMLEFVVLAEFDVVINFGMTCTNYIAMMDEMSEEVRPMVEPMASRTDFSEALNSPSAWARRAR